MEHYAEHKQENNALSLWDFLRMHYAGGDQEQDKDHHHKLPFKSCSENLNHIVVVVAQIPVMPSPARPFYAAERQVWFHTTDFIRSAYTSAIWQPPKYSTHRI